MRFGDLAHRQALVAFADEDVAGGVENLLPQQPLATPLASGHGHGQERNEEDERNETGEAAGPGRTRRRRRRSADRHYCGSVPRGRCNSAIVRTGEVMIRRQSSSNSICMPRLIARRLRKQPPAVQPARRAAVQSGK